MARPYDTSRQTNHLRRWQEEHKDRQRQMGREQALRINAQNVDPEKIRELLRKRFPHGSPQMSRELGIPRSTAGQLMYPSRNRRFKMTPRMAERLLRIVADLPYEPFRAQKRATKPDPQEKPWNLTQMLKDSAHLKDPNYMRRQITGIANAAKAARAD